MSRSTNAQQRFGKSGGSVFRLKDFRKFELYGSGGTLRTKPCTRRELFEQERPELQPLPDTAFEKYCVTQGKVPKNYHVQLGQDKHFYSVPYQLIGKTIKVIYTQDTVEIYDGLNR